MIAFNDHLSLEESYQIYKESTPVDHMLTATFKYYVSEAGYSESEALLVHQIYGARLQYGEKLLEALTDELENPVTQIHPDNIHEIAIEVQEVLAIDQDAQINIERTYPDLRPCLL